jgi:iron complex transport system permease protein
MPQKIFLVSLGLLIVSIFLYLFGGLTAFEDTDVRNTVLYSIRLPRLLVACLCGASLSAAGVVSQGLFRNPLACPSVLGASSGGVLGAVLVYYCFNPWHHWYLLPTGAFLATLITMFCLLTLFRSLSQQNSSELLLCGFALTTVLGALSSFVINLLLPQIERASSLMQWMMGGFSGRGWNHILFALPFSLLGITIAFSLVRKLDVLTLGEERALSLNVNVIHLQRLCVLSIACLVGASISIAGALPFVSLVVPHITRRFTGSSHRLLLPCSILNGMLLLIMGDALAQKALYPRELEVGLFSALLGGVFFFFKLLRHSHV